MQATRGVPTDATDMRRPLVGPHLAIKGNGANRAGRISRSSVMKHLIIPLLLVGGFVALTTTEASAVIYCAAGVYRAGCVARPVVVAPRAVVVAPRPVVVAPRRRVY
jgi:hypothetical protein